VAIKKTITVTSYVKYVFNFIISNITFACPILGKNALFFKNSVISICISYPGEKCSIFQNAQLTHSYHTMSHTLQYLTEALKTCFELHLTLLTTDSG
jgi:hypothetical protein